MTDIDALERYVAKADPAAFEHLVRSHQAMVHAACRRHLREPHDVEDAVQETFLKLAVGARTVRTSLSSWLHRCAVNTAIDLVRRGATRRRHEAAAARPASTPPTSVEQIENEIDQALLELADEDRRLIVEHYLEGRTQTELAEDMSMSVATVSRRVQSALVSLRRILESRRVAVTAGALTAALTAGAADAAVPTALTQSLLKIGLSGAGSGTATGASTVTIGAITLTKLQLAVAAGVAALAAIGGTAWVGTQLAQQTGGPSSATIMTSRQGAPRAATGVIVVGDRNAPNENVYFLDDGQDIKLVSTPFIDDRLRLYQETVNPGQVEAIPEGADRMTFRWSADGLASSSSGFGMGPGWEWYDIVEYVLHKRWYEVDFEHPDLDLLELEGDWIIREGIGDRELFDATADVLGARGWDMHFEPVTVEIPVLVVSGEYRFHLVGEQRDEDHPMVYLFAGANPPEDLEGVGGSSRGIKDDRVGRRLGVPLIAGEGLGDTYIQWEIDRALTMDPRSPDYPRDLQRVLDNLSRQTGLQFRPEMREVTVWRAVVEN